MVDCQVCSQALSAPIVKCASYGVSLHKSCAKKTLGRSYYKNCYKQAKRNARYEPMVRRSGVFG